MTTTRATTDRARAAARGAVGGLRRRVLLHRRALAAVLTGLAVLLAAHDLQPRAPRTVPVWTAAHDLAAGERVQTADLRRTPFAPGSVPAGAVRHPGRVVGRVVAAPLRTGTPVTDVSVVAPPLVRSDPGRAVVPVRLGDTGVAALLRVGDIVDLVSVTDEDGSSRTATTVATQARVVALPRSGDGPGAEAPTGRLVVVSVYPTEVPSVVAAGVAGLLTVLLDG